MSPEGFVDVIVWVLVSAEAQKQEQNHQMSGVNVTVALWVMSTVGALHPSDTVGLTTDRKPKSIEQNHRYHLSLFHASFFLFKTRRIYITHNASWPLSDITGGILSDYVQLPLEPQKASYYFVFRYAVALPKLVELPFKFWEK